MSAGERRLLFLRWPDAATSGADDAPGGGTGPDDAFLERWTPAWERSAGGVFLDLSGTGRLLGGARDGAGRVCVEASRIRPGPAAGCASSRVAAVLAAGLAARARGRARAALVDVPAGSAAAFLAPFSLNVLGADRPAVALLRDLGVRTLGDLQRVPDALLRATLGAEGPRLGAEARGCDPRPLRHARPEERLVLAAAFARPLEGPAREAALRGALAARAHLACPDGPGAWTWWRLDVRWGRQGRQTVTAPGRGEGTLPAWRAQVDRLWRGLRRRRAGLSRLHLSAGPYRGAAPPQPGLFPGDDRQRRLAAAWRRAAASGPGALRWASEELLESCGVRWEDVADGDPPAAQNREGWLLPEGGGSGSSDAGKPSRSSG